MYYVVYDMEDNYITECKNYKELSKFFGKGINSMQSSVSRYVNGIRTSILNNNDHKFYKVFKYKENEDETHK